MESRELGHSTDFTSSLSTSLQQMNVRPKQDGQNQVLCCSKGQLADTFCQVRHEPQWEDQFYILPSIPSLRLSVLTLQLIYNNEKRFLRFQCSTFYIDHHYCFSEFCLWFLKKGFMVQTFSDSRIYLTIIKKMNKSNTASCGFLPLCIRHIKHI